MDVKKISDLVTLAVPVLVVCSCIPLIKTSIIPVGEVKATYIK